jgi:cyclopropane fatty-acyl-phospholipid synthase-like methyltransferase
MSTITPFFNPIEWVRAYRFNKENAKFEKSSYDLELFLYSKILNNNMLHWGYFEDPEVQPDEMSLKQVCEAQIRYAQNIVDQIVDKQHPILDVGCGMGGLAELMLEQKLKVEVLTPNKNQISYISNKHKDLPCHPCKFEQFDPTERYGTVINSESLQYITLDDAFQKLDGTILPNGRWIITDYFRTNQNDKNTGSHLLSDFKQHIKKHGWNILVEKDITTNVLPTIQFANLYIDRFLIPVKHYGYEKLRYKKGWLFYLTNRIRKNIDAKIEKERASVDPNQFVQDKRYLFFVLEKR